MGSSYVDSWQCTECQGAEFDNARQLCERHAAERRARLNRIRVRRWRNRPHLGSLVIDTRVAIELEHKRKALEQAKVAFAGKIQSSGAASEEATRLLARIGALCTELQTVLAPAVKEHDAFTSVQEQPNDADEPPLKAPDGQRRPRTTA